MLNHTILHGDAPLFMYLALHNTHGPVGGGIVHVSSPP